MSNEPVAFIDCFSGKPKLIDGYVIQTKYDIPLYTHPVNTCKHGVDDGACKECYQEVTHPAELTDEEIISTMVQFDVYSSDDHCLIEAGRAILRKASEK